jgi:hypothetical protein
MAEISEGGIIKGKIINLCMVIYLYVETLELQYVSK